VGQHESRWVPLLDWVAEDQIGYLGVDSLAVDPKNAANVYMHVGISYFNGGKSAILRSTEEWTFVEREVDVRVVRED